MERSIIPEVKRPAEFTPEDQSELFALSKKLFNGELFVVFPTKRTAELERYDALMSKKLTWLNWKKVEVPKYLRRAVNLN